MKVLDLFSGIGGFALGLERAGFETMAFCEADPQARKVLKKNWPHTFCFNDVRTLTKEKMYVFGYDQPDVICGGFPCQDISLAGKGAGVAGERSGLWFEFHRLIDELRPRYAIIENVSSLRSRGLDRVLRSLAEIGYDAEWHCIPASAIGAPHQRDRIWIVANPRIGRCDRTESGEVEQPRGAKAVRSGEAVANTNCSGLQTARPKLKAARLEQYRQQGCWTVEPNVGRVAHGVSNRVDRIRQLGNAVVPQIPELIGRAVLSHDIFT